MEKHDAMLWTAVLKQAQMGDEESQEVLDGENKARQKFGRPTVQEDLTAFLQSLKK